MPGRRFEAAVRLHRHVVVAHWKDGVLIGPDCGVRLNYRVGRFVKSYLRLLPWRDDLYYLQAQGYWTLGNWWLFGLTRDAACLEIALRCSESMLATQRPDGAWEYPNREWEGRIATAEGTWASLGLLESYRHTGEQRFLDGARRWHRFLEDEIGFQSSRGGRAVNYFAGRPGPAVPNNTAFVLRFLAELADLASEPEFLERAPALLSFLQGAQKPTGEFPYTVTGSNGEARREHFQCYQYNAFQCLDLMRYADVAGDADAAPLITRVLRFLRRGLATDGHSFYECGRRYGHVTYHTAVLAAAFAGAGAQGIPEYEDSASLAWERLLGLQRPDGSFPYSEGDYRVLSDQRPYPRSHAMILYHLLSAPAVGSAAKIADEPSG